MILFKKSKIVVDCFTYNTTVKELFPIARAINFFPDWWKQMPKEHMIDNL